MTSAQRFIAAAPPTRVVRVSNTTLFDLAARYLGDALYWPTLATINGLTDPWIVGAAAIQIPAAVPGGTPTGILGL